MPVPLRELNSGGFAGTDSAKGFRQSVRVDSAQECEVTALEIEGNAIAEAKSQSQTNILRDCYLSLGVHRIDPLRHATWPTGRGLPTSLPYPRRQIVKEVLPGDASERTDLDSS